MTWTRIHPQIWLWPDSCSVYAVEGPGGMVVINAGTGRWLEALGALPKPVIALACTHYFRDHSAGAARAAEAGIRVFVPEYERGIFADPAQHFRQRETYVIYENLWDHFAPVTPIPVADVLRDYVPIDFGGLVFEVVPLPGVTLTQVGLACRLGREDGALAVFCGEAIHSAGKVARIAPFQYDYNDLRGAVCAYYSAGKLRELRPDALFPSLGAPILHDADAALSELQQNLRALCAPRPEMADGLDHALDDELEEVTPHVWRNPNTWAHTHFLISESGKAMALDYGYNLALAFHGFPTTARPERRRALLHSLAPLERRFGIRRIDVVLTSHFHDDHVCGIPLLQRMHGTQCWAPENFADILENPAASAFPCTWPQTITVQRRLPLGEEFQWEEYTFRVLPMSGHTRFSAWIEFEADGRRYGHSGDQYFFRDPTGPGLYAQNRRAQNHVYRNGALLDSYARSAGHVLNWRPEILLQGHRPVMHTDGAFFEHIRQWNQDYEVPHRQASALGDDEAHFNLDGWGGWIWPYRIIVPRTGETAVVKVTVRNPLPEPATLELSLVLPPGWKGIGDSATLQAAPHAEVSCEMSFVPGENCRRQPIAVELLANGRPFGQVCEALVTVGHAEF